MPAPTPPRQGWTWDLPGQVTPAAGGPAATPPLATRLLRQSPSLPHSSCFYSLVPAKAKEVLSGLLPEERARRFRKLLPTPRQSSDSRRRGPSAPKVSRESAGPRARAASCHLAPRPPPVLCAREAPFSPPLTLRFQSPKLSHPLGQHEGKLLPAAQSPWPSPRGLACGRLTLPQEVRER